MEMNKKIILEEEAYRDLLYVTYDDLKQGFPQNETLIIAKLKENSIMEVPEPMYVSKVFVLLFIRLGLFLLKLKLITIY